jgi:alpha-galactosidase
MYACRSQMAPALVCSWDLRNRDLDYEFIRRFLAQWRQVADNYYGDFYPLTAYRIEDDIWMAWQFDHPEAGEGMVQAFRRPKSDITSMQFKLRGLDADAFYSMTDLDADNAARSAAQDSRFTGAELMEEGLLVSLSARPSAALITYRRENQG